MYLLKKLYTLFRRILCSSKLCCAKVGYTLERKWVENRKGGGRTSVKMRRTMVSERKGWTEGQGGKIAELDGRGVSGEGELGASLQGRWWGKRGLAGPRALTVHADPVWRQGRLSRVQGRSKSGWQSVCSRWRARAGLAGRSRLWQGEAWWTLRMGSKVGSPWNGKAGGGAGTRAENKGGAVA